MIRRPFGEQKAGSRPWGSRIYTGQDEEAKGDGGGRTRVSEPTGTEGNPAYDCLVLKEASQLAPLERERERVVVVVFKHPRLSTNTPMIPSIFAQKAVPQNSGLMTSLQQPVLLLCKYTEVFLGQVMILSSAPEIN